VKGHERSRGADGGKNCPRGKDLKKKKARGMDHKTVKWESTLENSLGEKGMVEATQGVKKKINCF